MLCFVYFVKNRPTENTLQIAIKYDITLHILLVVMLDLSCAGNKYSCKSMTSNHDLF